MTEVVLGGGDRDPALPVASEEYTPCRTGCPYRGEEHYHGKVRVMKPIPMSPEMQALMASYQEETRRLKEAGTPYWCIHTEDCETCGGTGRTNDKECPWCEAGKAPRGVTHPQTGWINDGFRHPLRKVTMKHGVICYECWGYVQEG